MFFNYLQTTRGHISVEVAISEYIGDALSYFFCVTDFKEIAIFSVVHQFRESHSISSNYWEARGHGLHGGDTLKFSDAGIDETVGRAV